MNLLELQNITAYTKNNPITEPSQIDKDKLKWNKMNEEWIGRIRENNQFWFTEYKFNPNDFLPHQLPHIPKIFELRDHLLKFGGEQACMPVIDTDADKILSRGQFWYGDIMRMKRGQPSRCHSNSAELWDKNRDTMKIVTGYALAEDGMWNQHSWCIQVRPRKNIILETTFPRVGYFGFVLTDEEAEEFLENNY